jgi:hypothetical protein
LFPLWSIELISQFFDHFTDGRTPWMGDQLIARPLPKHGTTQTQNKLIHTSNIHALCGIRSHDLGFRASKDSTCLRPLGYRDRQLHVLYIYNSIQRCRMHLLQARLRWETSETRLGAWWIHSIETHFRMNIRYFHRTQDGWLYEHQKWTSIYIYLWLYSPLLDLGLFFSFLILVCRTPWTGDQ